MTKTDKTEALEALDALHSYMISAVSWSYDDGTQFTAVCTLFDKIRAALTSQVPEGWQLVPKEPTRDMLDAGMFEPTARCSPSDRSERIYKAMLAAAPVYGKDGG